MEITLRDFLMSFQELAEKRHMESRTWTDDGFGSAIRDEFGKCPIEIAANTSLWLDVTFVEDRYDDNPWTTVKTQIVDGADGHDDTLRRHEFHTPARARQVDQARAWRAILLKLGGLWKYRDEAVYTPRMD